MMPVSPFHFVEVQVWKSLGRVDISTGGEGGMIRRIHGDGSA
jgi:hypothetical protein